MSGKAVVCAVSASISLASADLPYTLHPGSTARAAEVMANFTRLDSALQGKAAASSLDSLRRKAKSDSVGLVVAIAAKADSASLAAIRSKAHTDSSALAGRIQTLQTTVAGLGAPGLPTSALSGTTDALAKFTGANAVGSSSVVDAGGTVSTTSKFEVSGGKISLTNLQTNFLDFGTLGVGGPANGARSLGTKAVWYSQQDRAPGEVDYATGIDGGTLWNSVPLNNSSHRFRWYGGIAPLMTLDGLGNLSVAGVVNANVVATGIPASKVADFVFEPGYPLAPLAEVEAFTREHRHLPEVPSAQEVEAKGLDLAQMNLILLKKVEELTLHAIAQEKELAAQRERLEELERSRGR